MSIIASLACCVAQAPAGGLTSADQIRKLEARYLLDGARRLFCAGFTTVETLCATLSTLCSFTIPGWGEAALDPPEGLMSDYGNQLEAATACDRII